MDNNQQWRDGYINGWCDACSELKSRLEDATDKVKEEVIIDANLDILPPPLTK